MGYLEYKQCIEACLKCAAICNHCAAECAKENETGRMEQCIILAMECAVICYTSAQLMSIGSSYSIDHCTMCAKICIASAHECSRHDNDYCRECAAICTECAEECMSMSQVRNN